MNKRFLLLLISAAFLLTSLVYAAEEPVVLSDEELDYAQMASFIDGTGSPYLKGDYVIFTADRDARFVGIAFDFENYKTIHPFKIRNVRDIEYNVKDSLYFYILKLPKSVQVIKYRLVVDGLWTTDPLNDNRQYDRESGLVMSVIDVSRDIPPATEEKKDGLVHFVYRGESGQKIRLGGSFTNWDSWIYEMQEVEPGLYEFALALPPGEYQYAYYTGITSFVDNTNPVKCYSPEGKEASLLIVSKD